MSRLICQCLELGVVNGALENGVDILHDYRHDISKVGRFRTQGLKGNDAVHFVDGWLCLAASQ